MIGSSTGFARRLLRWYAAHRRDLPWRTAPDRPGPLDPYHVLISETMLQQTRVAAVIPYFHRFLARFPTAAALAEAPEQEVLRLWQGLGYYSRARNLQAAARAIVRDCGGCVPSDPERLMQLPGVGRYTAGAIASIAFDRPAPILDGNVTRVLCRIDRIETDPRERATRELLWRRAEEILPERNVGDFNSALMELGATVCTPRNPQCLLCPVRVHCRAAADGVQERIPAPRKAQVTPLFQRTVWCIRDGNRWLVEQRPARGRWASMWQFVTTESPEPAPTPLRETRELGIIRHGLTHRRYEFAVRFARFTGAATAAESESRRWATTAEIDLLPLPRPHLKIIEMLRSTGLLDENPAQARPRAVRARRAASTR